MQFSSDCSPFLMKYKQEQLLKIFENTPKGNIVWRVHRHPSVRKGNSVLAIFNKTLSLTGSL